MAVSTVTLNLADGLKAQRNLEIHYVNTGTAAAPVWEILGRGVEDVSMEFKHDVKQATDVLGNTEVTVGAAMPALELDPLTVRAGSTLTTKLMDIERRNATAELSNFEVLNVHCYSGTAPAFTAELHKGCTIVPKSLGGSTTVDMPVTVYLSNNKTLGTAVITAGVPVFTADAAA